MDAFGLQTSSTEADGKSVWSCSPDAGIKLCETSFARRRWLSKPDTGRARH